MRDRRMPSVIAALVLVTTAVARADQTDDYIKAQMQEFHLPGLSLAVIKNGAVIKASGYGLADRDRKTPATPDTVYKIGSVSKQFVATAIMLLVQEGRIGLDDPVNKYLDAAPLIVDTRHRSAPADAYVWPRPRVAGVRSVSESE